MKKKIIALSLITVMVVCNSMTVWATDTWEGDQEYTKGTTGNDNADRTYADKNTIDKNSAEKDVTASFQLTTADKYSVTISWGNMEFEPQGTLTNDWNDGQGYYEIDGCTGWTSSGNTVTITNNSNKDIKASLSGEISPNYKTGYIIDTEKQTAAKFTFGYNYGTTNVSTAESISNLVVKSPATYTADIKSNVFTTTVGVEAALEKSTTDKVTDLTLGTLTLTIAESQ